MVYSEASYVGNLLARALLAKRASLILNQLAENPKFELTSAENDVLLKSLELLAFASQGSDILSCQPSNAIEPIVLHALTNALDSFNASIQVLNKTEQSSIENPSSAIRERKNKLRAVIENEKGSRKPEHLRMLASFFAELGRLYSSRERRAFSFQPETFVPNRGTAYLT